MFMKLCSIADVTLVGREKQERMEEADRIIIPLLQQIGCVLPAGVESVSQFESNTLISVLWHIFHLIDKRNVFPKVIPSGTPARFKLASQLSRLVADTGFKGNHAFETFLYPGEKDMREVLTFLVNKLPRSADEKEADGDGDDSGAASESASIQRMVMDSLKAWGNRSWSVLTAGSGSDISTFVSTVPLALPSINERDRDELRYATHFQPLLSVQCTRNQLAPSLFEINARDVVLAAEQEKEFEDSKGEMTAAKKLAAINLMVGGAFRNAARDANSGGTSALDSMKDLMNRLNTRGGETSTFIRRTELGQPTDEKPPAPAPTPADTKKDEETEEQLKKKATDELDRLQEELKRVTGLVNAKDGEISRAQAGLGPLQGEITAIQTLIAQIETENRGKEAALALLPEADKNLAELTKISEASAKRLIELSEEWEKYRLPLLATIRRKKQLLNDRKADVTSKIEQMKRMRDEMKTLTTGIREKEDLLKSSVDEFNKLPKSINRQVYVARIMNIVKNLDKQKQEITNVLGDVRRLQRDINSVSETLSRSFAVADEIVFSVAAEGKKDPTAVQTYKNIVALRTGFEKLVQSVADTGRTKNELLDIQARIESIESRNSSLNMQRVTDDLTSVRNENKILTTKLKTLKAQFKK